MRLEFESWVLESELFSENGEILIQEGIKCFKASAYRGAFLFSYLAFKISLRDRLIKSNYINRKRSDEQWKKTIKKLESEESWEPALDSILFNSKESFNIYELNEDLKKEYTFWRKKRNDCAHAKEAIFSQSTVQMFWEFLCVNFVKFQVLGQKKYLMDRLYEDFRYHKEVSATIKQMESLEIKDISYIIKMIDEKISHNFNCADDIFEIYGLNEFWKKVSNGNEKLKEGFLFYITQNFYTFDKFYKAMPELLGVIKEVNSDFIDKQIIEEIYSGKFCDSRMWAYVVDLLKIMDSTRVNKFIDTITIYTPINQPNEVEVDELKKYGYFIKWKYRIFEEKLVNRSNDGIKYIANNYNYNNITTVLDNIEWDECVFDALEEVIEWSNEKHGRIYNTTEYYKFIAFQHELIAGKYKENTIKCIKEYRNFDGDRPTYIEKYFKSDI